MIPPHVHDNYRRFDKLKQLVDAGELLAPKDQIWFDGWRAGIEWMAHDFAESMRNHVFDLELD